MWECAECIEPVAANSAGIVGWRIHTGAIGTIEGPAQLLCWYSTRRLRRCVRGTTGERTTRWSLVLNTLQWNLPSLFDTAMVDALAHTALTERRKTFPHTLVDWAGVRVIVVYLYTYPGID